MNQSSSLGGVTFAIVFRSNAVRALPDDSSAEQSYHTDNGEDDVRFVPNHNGSCVLGMRECDECGCKREATIMPPICYLVRRLRRYVLLTSDD